MSEYFSKRGQRQFWVASGGRSWVRQQGKALIGSAERALWVGEEAPDSIASLSPQKARQRLGQELDLLIFDAWSGFDPDAFAAICGTLCGGGLLLLLLPPLGQWADFPDPYLRRIGQRPGDFRAGFVKRFIRLLQDQDWLLWLQPGQELPRWTPPATSPQTDFRLTQDQQQAVAELLRTARGRGRRPLVLIADRGRGKSTALGVAAAELVGCTQRPILVTAPHQAMVATLLQQAEQLLGRKPGDASTPGQSMLRFLPPDELLRQRPPADLVLVDEAAAIPGPLLESLLRQYNRIAFATTVHGYEGTGQGFLLRFSRRLDQLTPGWRRYWLKSPVRWGENDLLEAFLYRALLLDAEVTAPASSGAQPGPVAQLSGWQLAEDESLLRQVQGLLLSAHYRTRPSDLRRLLDDPDLDSWVICADGIVIAVLLALREGGFESDLAQQISMGRRRPRGHLLPQTLAHHAGFAEAAQLRYRRILRIAVEPGWQRRGLGLRLVEQLQLQSRSEAMDFVGCSFGATPALLAFWYRSGFRPVRIGTSRDAASGQHSAIMLHALSAPAKGLQARLQQRFDEQLPYLLGDPLRDLEAEVVARLFHPDSRVPALSAQDRQDLQAFAKGYRDYASARLALWRWTCQAATIGVDKACLEAAILKVLEGRSWAEVAAQLGLSGQQQVLRVMRQAVAENPL